MLDQAGGHVLSLRAGSVMAKSKNHTAHNQTYKAHRHSIKKPKKSKYSSRKGVSRGMQTDDGWLCSGSAAPDLGCYLVLGSVVEPQASNY